MHTLTNWKILADTGSSLVALEYFSIDRNFVFSFFDKEAKQRHLPLYYWNVGYSSIQEVMFINNQYGLKSSDIVPEEDDILKELLQKKEPGIFLIDDLIEFEGLETKEKKCRESEIQNLFHYLQNSSFPCHVILMGNYIQLSNKLKGIEVLKFPLPDAEEIQQIVKQFCHNSNLISHSQESQQRLAIACQGLPRGEIELILPRYAALSQNKIDAIANNILTYKVQQLRGLGLEFIAEPDVKSAGGLDLLQQFLLEKVVKLNEPAARSYHLRPPRGMLLLGVPGTGKTLSAKLAAKALGYSLLALSWGNVLGSDNPDKTLAQILETADALNKVILLADDFDKGFTDWQAGGVAQRLSQRLLTWMQEHTSDVMMVATVNRIQLLPSELKRRFDDGGIWFVDLPEMGAMYEIFQIHLQKYFPTQFGEGKDPWTQPQWYHLLKAYRGATPVEIAKAVERCAIDFYCGLSETEREQDNITPHIEIESLHSQLEEFVMASQRDAEELQAIRNTAYYCRRASSEDNSKFAIASQQLFDYNPHQFATD